MERMYFKINDFMSTNISTVNIWIDEKPSLSDVIPMSYKDTVEAIKEELFQDESASILLNLTPEDYLKLGVIAFLYISLSKFEAYDQLGFMRDVLKRMSITYPHNVKDAWTIAVYIVRQCSLKRQFKVALEIASRTKLSRTNKSLKYVAQKFSVEDILTDILEAEKINLKEDEIEDYQRDSSGVLLELAILSYSLGNTEKAIQLLELSAEYATPYIPAEDVSVPEDETKSFGYLPLIGLPTVSFAIYHNSLFVLNGEAVTRRVHESVNSASRVKDLELQLRELKSSHEHEIAMLVDLLQTTQQAAYLSDHETDFKPTLKGRRVVVIGDDNRAPVYRAIIESDGGEFFFLPGFDQDGRSEALINKGDGILLITAYCGHTKWNALKACGDMRNVFLVNTAGVKSFKDKVDEMKNWFIEQDSIVDVL